MISKYDQARSTVLKPIVALCLSLFSTTLFAQATFTPLGELPGGNDNSKAYDVSADGSVVTGISGSSQGQEVFRWTENGGMFGLGQLTGMSYSVGLGVADDGSVIAGNDKKYDSSSTQYGYRWSLDAGLQQFSVTDKDTANDVSANGKAIVGRNYNTRLAYRWTATDGMVDLGVTVAGSYSHSEAMAISDDGTVVVGVSYSNDLVGYPRTGEAFRWTAGDMQGLGDFPGGYNNSLSQANAVSADGEVVVGRGEDDQGYVAFRWSSTDGLVKLGVLPTPDYYSEAYGVSADGTIVVGTSGLYGDRVAFIWNAANGMRNLKTVLQNDYGLNLTGWSLREASKISPDGNVIIGYGINPQGRPKAWRVQLNTPAASEADIAVSATGPSVAYQSEDTNFNFTVQNNGTELAKTPALKIAFINGAKITTATADVGQCDINGSNINCAFTHLPVDGTATVAVTAAPGTAGSASLQADASAMGVELTPADNHVTVGFEVKGTPQVNIISPTPGASFTIGDLVSFQASATDFEDGDVSASLQWSSDIDGAIGSGAQVTTDALSQGWHLVTANATDSEAKTGSAAVYINIKPVANSVPTISLSAPLNNASYTLGDTVVMQASAADAEDGNLDSAIQWSSSIDGALGTGATVSYALSAGTHVLTATVSDSKGATASDTVNVTVNSATLSYCTASGNNSSYEWIQQITVGSYSKASGNNGGYADFTDLAGINLARGSNSIGLQPGFRSGSYIEYWGVWIDFNQDGQFGSGERVYSTTASVSRYGSFTVPSTALAGETRMRVVMRWGGTPGACGSFTYGEVEDYKVIVAP